MSIPGWYASEPPTWYYSEQPVQTPSAQLVKAKTDLADQVLISHSLRMQLDAERSRSSALIAVWLGSLVAILGLYLMGVIPPIGC